MADLPHELYTDYLTVNDSLTIDLDASFTSQSRKLDSTPGYAIQFVWSGASTPVGTFSLECSNDNVNWVDIDETDLSVTGSAGGHMINVERPAYLYVRVKYVRTSGSGGVVQIIMNGVS